MAPGRSGGDTAVRDARPSVRHQARKRAHLLNGVDGSSWVLNPTWLEIPFEANQSRFDGVRDAPLFLDRSQAATRGDRLMSTRHTRRLPDGGGSPRRHL